MQILCVVGSRPNIVKMAEFYIQMVKRNDIEPMLFHIGQHFAKAT